MPYKDFFQYSRDILLIMDLDGEILEANNAAIEAYGYPYSEIKKLNVYVLRSPEAKGLLAEQLNQASKSGILFETSHQRKDGTIFAVEVNSKKILVQNKSFLLSGIRDITQRKQLEKNLAEQETNYKQLFDNMLAGFALHEIICDKQGNAVDYRFLEINPAFEEILGLKKQEVIGKTVKEIFPTIEESWIKVYGKVALQGKKTIFEQHLDILNKDFKVSAFSLKKGQFATTFEEVTDYRRTQRSLNDANQQLVMLNEELLATNEELTATNEELTAANEQLVATEEELREYNQKLHQNQLALVLAHEKMAKSEAVFRNLAENASDIIYQIGLLPTPHFEYVNKTLQSIMGFLPEDFYQDINIYYHSFHPDDCDEIKNLLQGNFKPSSTVRWLHPEGHVVWLEVFRTPIYDEMGKIIAVQGIARDINERKKAEEQLKKLSQHDAVTGIYNRAYFESELIRLNQAKEDVGLIIADLDGLKLVNDSFGHTTGDKLLKVVAEILKDTSASCGVGARIGGDEFAVIIPSCTEKMIVEQCQKIREKIDQYNQEKSKITLSISIGYALKNKDKSMTETFIEADNYMYREKLHRSHSSKSSLINTLKKAMEARDFITEGHAERLVNIVNLVAEEVGMSPSQIYDLCLLAQFHDIGKVGIPDQILFKPGSLTKDEWIQMQRHSEIGYRIAQASTELLPIAGWILRHHERWDGQGYPLGLKWEEIPIACRILAIADSYDAMTNDRPYRQALSHQKAINEIKLCAGTQFDPHLVPIAIKVLEKMLF